MSSHHTPYPLPGCPRSLSALFGLIVGFGVSNAQAESPTEAPSPGASVSTEPPTAVLTDTSLDPPKLLKDSQPEYPAAAKAQAIAATVLLDIDIDAAGNVQSASVVEASQTPEFGFEAAALAAAKLLQFSPALDNGTAVPVRISYRFRFVPEPAPAAPPSEPKADANPAPSPPVTPGTQAKGQLSGILQERGTRLPLSGVKVTVFRGAGPSAEGFETETDPEGRFRVVGLAPGAWRILADPEGYFPVRTTEEVKANSRTDVTYRIERGSYNPYDVEVETARLQREVNHIAIDAGQAERIPGSFGDPLAAVLNFPGVARTPLFSPGGGFAVRGSAPKDSRILVNGIDVPLLYHFGQLRSVVPAGMLETVNFYPGNFSVEYGRATGGIIDIDLKALKRRKIGGYADVSLMDTSLYLEVPLGDKLSIALAGRRSYIDGFLGAVLSGGGNSVAAPRYYDAQALISYRPSAEHQFKGFFLFSDDMFEVLFKDPLAVQGTSVVTDIGLTTQFYRVIGEYQYVPNLKLENKLKVSFGNDKNAFNFGQLAKSDTNLYQLQARDTVRYAFSDMLALRGGADYLYQRRNVDAIVPSLSDDENPGGNLEDSSSATTQNDYHSVAAFAELELKPWKGMLAVPGLRFDYFGRTDEIGVSPRVVLRQTLNPLWTLKGGMGLFQQEPTFAETDVAGGNPNLGTEKAVHYSAGFEFTPASFLNLGATTYYKVLYDTVGPTDAVTTSDGIASPVNYTNGAEGRAMGVELSARHELHKNLFAWVSYTLSRSERKDPDNGTYSLFDYDQTHNLTAIASYRLPRNWEIGVRFRYVTGNLYTPTTGAVYSVDTNEYAPISGGRNSARVGDFHQLDIRVDKRWVFNSWMLNAYLDVQNVYNQPNVENLDYNYDYTSSEPQTGLPIVPVVGLRGEF